MTPQGPHKLLHGHKQRHKLSYECKIHSYDGRNGHKLLYEYDEISYDAIVLRRTIVRQLVGPSYNRMCKPVLTLMRNYNASLLGILSRLECSSLSPSSAPYT